MKNEKFIEIEKVIGGKSPRLLKMLPKFLIRYLKRVIHEDDLNEALATHGHKKGAEFVEGILSMMQVSYTVAGIENLDPNGRYLFASNHPLGGLDGMILIHAISKHYPNVKFPVNDLLMHLKQLHPVFIPVNKHGSQSTANAKLMEDAFASSDQILYFPAGLCSRKQKGGIIEDLEWKKSFIAKAVKHERDVVPVFFSGRNSKFFYNFARIRSKLGIKANIEMLYLVDEMYRQKGQSITVTFGKSIPYQTFDKSKTPQQWAEWVKRMVYQTSTSTK